MNRIWLVRIIGLLMLLVFVLLFVRLEQRLVTIRQQRGVPARQR